MKPTPSVHRWLIALTLATLTLAAAGPALAGDLAPEHLRCEYLENPLGIDEVRPRLGWIVTSPRRGQLQSAWQVLVASRRSALGRDQGDLWDSGKVAGDQAAHVVYAGKPLGSGQRAWWKVRVWDNDGQPSEWSETACWEMGLLQPEDWHGKWIARTADTHTSATPLLRRAFNLDGKVRRARLYVMGLGYHELSINGRRIGDHRLDPGYTRYDRRVLYVTHDVTAALRQGRNALGVMLGNGWYNVQAEAAWDFSRAPWRASPRLRLELRAELENGRRVTLATDEKWKTSDSPIVFSGIYGGETYDARREQRGWDTPDFDDTAWQAALAVEAPKGNPSAQMMPAIEVDRELKPVKVTEPAPGVFVYDFGQNMAGTAELNIEAPAGTKIVMKYGERLRPDGRLDQKDIGVHVWAKGKNQPFQTDTYILKGEGRERWQSRFVYHGFQYVEVTGAPDPLTADNLRALFMHTAIPEVGRFACSNALLNKIWISARWAYLSNLYGIPTDCPHREKNGWTGDAHLACEQGLLTYDGAAVYTKWINDLGDEQRPTGELPGIVPTGGWGYAWGNGPAWDSAFALIPWHLYEYCGDTRLLTRHYEGLRRYVDYLTSKSVDGGIVKIGLGDWAPWKTKTPEALTSTGYYYRDTLVVARTAQLLGRLEEAKKYEALAASIRAAFNRAFYDPATGLYANGSQTALSCALYQGLAEESNRERIMQNLLAAIERTDNHIDTGILGAKYLLNTLTDMGRPDVAYRIVAQETQPGWGWWIKQGATTLWEQWDGRASQNHIMYGDVSAWMTKTLAGINPDPAAPGFKHILIRPNPVEGVRWAKADYNSIRGWIASEWRREKDGFRLKVVVPANATATVIVPRLGLANLTESDKPVAKAPERGILKVDEQSERWLVEIGSGEYVFLARGQ